jgi:hypothetical protein
MTVTLGVIIAMVILLGGCVTPPLDALNKARAACAAGDQNACSAIPGIEAWRQQYNARLDRDLLQLGVAVVGTAAVVAPIAIVASHPGPHGPPPGPRP